MMVAEIFAGSVFGSMALLADGWHMSTHMAAFLIAAIAYAVARRNRNNPRFSFGTGKVGVVGAFASSILLLVVAVVMVYESLLRLLHPAAIQFGDALLVAAIGLVVNIICALILNGANAEGAPVGGHSHGHSHSHDKNLKAAYIHVIADAFTSVTAIFALVMGMIFGIVWVDAVVGFLGSAMIAIWAFGIIKDTIVVLVDYFPEESDLEQEIRKAFETLEGTTIHDLHLWQVASGKFAAIIAVEAKKPRPVDFYHELVSMHEELVHVSIEVTESQ
jgi:cation diffusion facilitator family transporter